MNDDSEDGSSDDRPSGVISTRFAKTIPLDTTRVEFDRRAQVPPVDVERQEAGRRTFSLKGLSQKRRREYVRKYGAPKGDVLIFPPETYTCLRYHSEKVKTYSWRFCFGEEEKLDTVSTAPPL